MAELAASFVNLVAQASEALEGGIVEWELARVKAEVGSTLEPTNLWKSDK